MLSGVILWYKLVWNGFSWMLFGLFLVHSLQDFFVKRKAMVQITSNTVATVNTILINWYVFLKFYK